MVARIRRITRPQLGLVLMLGAALVLSCERAHEAIVAPGAPLSPHAATRAVTAGQSAHFYLHGHPGNWTLFMGDRVPASLAAAGEVVFVALSGGDANLGIAHVQTRESATLAAIDALLGAPGSWACAQQTILTHSVLRCAKGTAVSFFLRLPDGAPTGDGYAGRGSMSLLRDGRITSLTAIDGSATYASWSDLTGTVRALVDLEAASQSAPYVEVNTPDTDRTANTGDHPDNFATADAVSAAAATRQWNISWYVDDHTQVLAQNLSQAAHDTKQAAYYAYDSVMGAAGYGYGRYETSTQLWLWRTYLRSTVAVPAGPPTAPAGLTAHAYNSSRVDLAWSSTSPVGASYDVERAPDAGGVAGTYALVASVTSPATSYSNTGLNASTTYWYRVRARNSAGVSDYTAEASAATGVPPLAPSGLSATASSASEIALAWTDNSSDETGFAVERAPDVAGAPGTWSAVATVAANTIAYTNSGLTGGTRYWYRVRTITATDVSAYASAVSATTMTASTVPTGLRATAASATRINLAWTDLPSETGYVIERAPTVGTGPGTFGPLATVAANVVSYADQTGLQPLTRYWYRIASTSVAGTSAFSAAVSATTLDVAPLAPTGLAAQAASFSRITLTWVDNATNETSYAIDRAPDNAGRAGTFKQLLTLPANSTSYSNDGLFGLTRYWYRVRAINNGGNVASATSVSATTPSQAGSRTDFYINAHEDDWMLFSGDVGASSIATAPKVVMLYVTAGDNNQGNTYWRLRETASMTGTDAAIAGQGSWLCATQLVNAHSLQRCTRANVVAYYMRLPDGGRSGDGFQGRGSLAYLRDAVVSSVYELTFNERYTWADVINTVRAVVDLESASQSAPMVEIHAPDPDRTINPGDHSDHWAVGDALVAAAATRSWNFDWYVQYGTQFMPVNLAQPAHDVKQNIFVAYDNVMGRGGFGYLQYDPAYQAWLWRTYLRRVAVP